MVVNIKRLNWPSHPKQTNKLGIIKSWSSNSFLFPLPYGRDNRKDIDGGGGGCFGTPSKKKKKKKKKLHGTKFPQ